MPGLSLYGMLRGHIDGVPLDQYSDSTSRVSARRLTHTHSHRRTVHASLSVTTPNRITAAAIGRL